MATKAKGTMDNPYTMSECDSMLDAGTWPGGYVKDDDGKVTYVMKSVTVYGYSGSGDIPNMVRMEFTGVENLRKGDVLVWRWQDAKGKWSGHAVIYVEGVCIFHAHGKVGSPTNQTNDLESYWLKKKYIPVDPIVYRKEE